VINNQTNPTQWPFRKRLPRQGKSAVWGNGFAVGFGRVWKISHSI